jgi:hypothetical protein
LTRWRRGEAEVEAMLAAGDLQRVAGAQADGAAWLDKARRTAATAAVVSDDADSGVVLAYDAARFACTALLIQQGLRPTTKGGHYTVERAVRAQFGDAFKPFAALRRRRNELEYPVYAGEEVERSEAAAVLVVATALVDAVARLLPELGLF